MRKRLKIIPKLSLLKPNKIIFTLTLFLTLNINLFSQQVYFQETFFKWAYLNTIEKTDSSYLVSGNYDNPDFVNQTDLYPGSVFEYEYDFYGNKVDSIIRDHTTSGFSRYEYFFTYFHYNSNNSKYFKLLQMIDTSGQYCVITKYNPTGDTIFTDTLKSKITPDTNWWGAYKSVLNRRSIATNDGGIAVLAKVNGYQYYTNYLYKYDSLGNIEWKYSCSNDSIVQADPVFYPVDLIQLPDSSFICSYKKSFGYYDYTNHLVLKRIDKNGNEIDSKTFYNNNVENGSPYLAYNFSDSCIYLSYFREYYEDPQHNQYHDFDICIHKLDISLNNIWVKRFGNTNPYIVNGKTTYRTYAPNEIRINKNNNIIIGGLAVIPKSNNNHTYLNFLLEVNLNGDSLWFKAYEFTDITGNNVTTYTPLSFVVNNDGGYTIATNIYTDDQTYWSPLIYRVDSNGCPDPQCSTASIADLSKKINNLSIYPNPAKEFVNIDLEIENDQIEFYKIYDSRGKLVLSDNVLANNFTINIMGFSSGIYFIEATTNSGEIVLEKFVKE